MKTLVIFILIYLVFSFFLKRAKSTKQQESTQRHEPPRYEPDHPESTGSASTEDSFLDLLRGESTAPEPEPQPISANTQPAYNTETLVTPVTAMAEPALRLEQMPSISTSAVPSIRLYRNLTRRNLRDGIILAEILGPCIANRRPEQQVGNF